MEHIRYFQDLFESIPDFRKVVLLMFSFKNDVDLFTECGFSKNDINRPCIGFKNIFFEQNQDYLDYIKDHEEAIIENTLNN